MDWGWPLQRIVRTTHRARASALLSLVMLLAASGAASAAPITEFSVGLPPGSDPGSLTAGPDGAVWFVDTGAIGRITATGTITEFTAGLNPGSMPHAIALGGDGNLWFTDDGTTKAIGRITPTGTITETSSGLLPGSAPYELTPGASGTLWFTDQAARAIGRIIPSSATVTEFAYTSDAVPNLDEITEGPDGNVYFTDKGNTPGVGKITPAGTITEATTASTSMPSGIGPGPDGNVWFSDQGTPPAIGRDAAGSVTEFTTANDLQLNSAPDEITPGPDGNVWFDDQYAAHNAVGRVTPAGQITEFSTAGTPWKLVGGSDANLWLLQSQPEAVLRITPTGSVTAFTSGLSAGANLIDTDITEGPDGNVWFVDKGTPTAIGRADVQLPPTATTTAFSAVGTSTATVSGTVNPRGAATSTAFRYGTTPTLGATTAGGTLRPDPAPSTVTVGLAGLPAATTIYYRVVATNVYGTATGAVQTFRTTPSAVPIGTPRPRPTPTPPGTRTTTIRLDNQLIALVTPLPTACTATGRIGLTLTTLKLRHSRAHRLRFASATLYLDRGVRHVRFRRSHGRRHRMIVFTANRVLRRLPARPSLSLRGLRPGAHTLRVHLRFTRIVTHDGHRRTAFSSATLRVGFRVC